jgi:hypothetical protein
VCCRLTVSPLDLELALTLLPVGLFLFVNGEWRREIPEEGCSVKANMDEGGLHLAILPTITSYDHHHGKRITAGVYLEMATRYAEKCDGRIVQHANIAGCIEDGVTDKLLAFYPHMPLTFDRICAGFREIILGEPAS